MIELILALFLAIEVALAGLTVRGWRHGRRLAIQDAAAIDRLSQEAARQSTEGADKSEEIIELVGASSPRGATSGSNKLPGALAWLTNHPDGSAMASVTPIEAGELYDRERMGIADELARLANVLLLTGICGTLATIGLALRQADDLEKLPLAFSVTFVAVFLAAFSTYAQHTLARQLDSNAKNIVLTWPRLALGKPVRPGEVDSAVAVQISAELANLQESFGKQEDVLRELCETIRDQIQTAVRSSDTSGVVGHYEEVIGALAPSVMAVSENLEIIADEAASLRTAVADFAAATSAASEAGHVVKQLANEAATSREGYKDALKAMAREFEQSMGTTVGHMATLDKSIKEMGGQLGGLVDQAMARVDGAMATQVARYFEQLNEVQGRFFRSIEEMGGQLGGLVDQAMTRVDAAMATQVTQYFDKLNIVQERFFRDLANIENMAPGVTRVLQEMEPSAHAAVSALGESRAATTAILAETGKHVSGVGLQVTESLRTVEDGLRRVHSALGGIHAVTEGQLQSTHAASERALATVRWTLVASASTAAMWLILISGWLWWIERL